jgi:PAS domain S-box-containing protein
LDYIFGLLRRASHDDSGETRESDYRIKKATGEWCWYRMTVTPFAVDEKESSQVLVVSFDITARKQMEMELRDSQRLLQAALDAISVRLFWKDKNSTFLGCNRLVAEDAGLDSPQAIIGLNDFMLFPTQAEAYRADDLAVMESGKAKLNFEESLVTPNGKQLWLRTSKVPLKNNLSEVIGVIGTYEDITERKQAEAALNESRAQTERFQEQLKTLYEINGELSRVETLDELFLRTVEFGKFRLGFDRLGLLLLDEEKQMIRATFGVDAKGSIRDERKLSRPLANDPVAMEVVKNKQRLGYWENVQLWDEWQVVGQGTSAMSVIWDKEQVVGWIAIDNLITQTPITQQQLELLVLYAGTLGSLITRKRNEVEIRESEARYRAMINLIPDLIFRTNRKGVYINIKPMDDKTSAEAYVGKKLSDFLPVDVTTKMIEAVTKTLDTKTSQTCEYQLSAPNGQMHHFEARMVVSAVEEVLVIVRDITEQKNAETEHEALQQQLIDAQKQALLELSTPIIPLIDQIIIMPLVGSIDTQRAKEITRTLLSGISLHGAHIVIIDITGVPLVDSSVAEHLNRSIQAARLKGAHTIITGISDAVAETIVDMGIDWSKIETLRDLQSGLIAAFKRLKFRLQKA